MKWALPTKHAKHFDKMAERWRDYICPRYYMMAGWYHDAFKELNDLNSTKIFLLTNTCISVRRNESGKKEKSAKLCLFERKTFKAKNKSMHLSILWHLSASVLPNLVTVKWLLQWRSNESSSEANSSCFSFFCVLCTSHLTYAELTPKAENRPVYLTRTNLCHWKM